MRSTVRITPIEAAAFAPYGEVVVSREARRTDHSGHLANLRPEAPIDLTTVTLQPSALPFTLTKMERHEFSSQSFFPLSGPRYLIAVAPGGDEGPDAKRIAAFSVPGDTGITYRAGVWHAPLCCLDGPAAFAILMWRVHGPGDEEFRDLPAPVLLAE